MKALPESLDLIAARLDDLERRVVALERARPDAAGEPVASLRAAAPVATWPEPQAEFTSAFPVLGGALLGIAGAYLLRAVSGTSLLSRSVVALIAALYAGAWLFAAARAARGRKLAGALYAAVSILILAPMLWEMTVRFNAMHGTVAAVILALYVAAATVPGLRRGSAIVFSVAFAGSAIAAVALSVATHQMVVFTYLLLAMVMVCEWVARKLDARGIRLLVALAADVAVWTLLLIYRLPPADRTDYPAAATPLVLAAALLLFVVELVTLAQKVLARGHSIPILQAMQAMASFALWTAALIWLIPDLAVPVLGSLCLALAAGCYVTAYGPIRRHGPRRNFRILSVWAACLLLGAVFTVALAPAASIALSLAAVAAVVWANRIASKTLELQGVLFLLVAAVGSGLAAWAAHALAGAGPATPGAPVLAVAACAVLSYALARERSGEEWRKQALHLVPALLAAFAIAALLTGALLSLTRLFLTPDVFHIALIRTLALCLLAMALAYAGPRLNRIAMVRTAYVAVAFVTAKLVFEDLRHGHMEFTAGSIFAVALTFIAVPRLTRLRKSGSAN